MKDMNTNQALAEMNRQGALNARTATNFAGALWTRNGRLLSISRVDSAVISKLISKVRRPYEDPQDEEAGFHAKRATA